MNPPSPTGHAPARLLPRLLRGAAICSSLGLAAWLVLDAQRSAAPPVHESPQGAASASGEPSASGASGTPTWDGLPFLPSSKSSTDAYFRRFADGTEDGAALGRLEPPSSPTYFASSKSAGPPSAGLFFDDGTDGAFGANAGDASSGADVSPPVAEPRDTFLPTSKSANFPLFDEQPTTNLTRPSRAQIDFLPNTKSTVTIRLPEVIVPPPAPRTDAPEDPPR